MKLPICLFLVICGMCISQSQYISSIAEIAQQLPIKLPCSYYIKCDVTIYAPVWATDGNVCHFFKNKCLLLIENCDRQNQGLKPLWVTNIRDCFQYCPRVQLPICGLNYGFDPESPDRCLLDYYLCMTGQPVITQGDCKCCRC